MITNKYGLTIDHYRHAAEQLNCGVAAIRAVDEVESRSSGFIMEEDDPHHGEPRILFERHIFHRLTKGRWSVERDAGGSLIWSDISNPTRGGYGKPGGHQHDRLARAVKLDREAALQSASWGRFQIMGFNWRACGYPTLQAFINAMYRSEADHLEAFVGFIKSQGLAGYLRRHQWSSFARRYNGSSYAANSYHTKLANAYRRHANA